MLRVMNLQKHIEIYRRYKRNDIKKGFLNKKKLKKKDSRNYLSA